MSRPEILLHPNIPKPLHGTNPRTLKGQEWWDEQRQIAYAKTDYHCAACGVHKQDAMYHRWLEAHELYDYDYKNGRLTIKEIVALCHACHNYIHCGRMQAMVDKGEMPAAKMEAIIRHGDAIVEKAGLSRPAAPTEVAEWGKWRLVIDGKEYAGKFKTFDEWANHYNQ